MFSIFLRLGGALLARTFRLQMACFAHLKHSAPLYLQLSCVWFVTPQRKHRFLSPAGWPDFPSLAWPFPRFEKRPRDFRLSRVTSLTPRLSQLALVSPPWEFAISFTSLRAASCAIASLTASWKVKFLDKSFCLTCSEHNPQIKLSRKLYFNCSFVNSNVQAKFFNSRTKSAMDCLCCWTAEWKRYLSAIFKRPGWKCLRSRVANWVNVFVLGASGNAKSFSTRKQLLPSDVNKIARRLAPLSSSSAMS